MPRGIGKLIIAGALALTLSSCTPIWNGDMSTGNLSQYYRVNACPGHVTVVNSPGGRGGLAAKLDVLDSDSSCPLAYGAIRADLLSNPVLENGGEYWVRFSTFFPSNFPTANTDWHVGNWLQIAEIYGPPFGGSPPIGIGTEDARLVFKRDRAHNYDTVWSAPLPLNSWADFVLHVKMATDNTGFVELTYDGRRQTFADGSTRLNMATMAPGVNDGAPNWLDTDLYRGPYKLGETILYHAGAGIAKAN